jgi:hypothetical protein
VIADIREGHGKMPIHYLHHLVLPTTNSIFHEKVYVVFFIYRECLYSLVRAIGLKTSADLHP